MTPRDWSLFKYEIADFFFKKQLDEAFLEGRRTGVEYAANTLGFAVRNLDTSAMTKTQIFGHKASLAAIIEAKKDVMRNTGVAL
jgi:hypothetical protein|tara:strand:+ start:3364 stop:3615 length:252 start_codon:yes stop_codon:yes gene_type:complete